MVTLFESGRPVPVAPQPSCRRAARAAQAPPLRRALAHSALLHLTLAVGLFAALRLLVPPAPATSERVGPLDPHDVIRIVLPPLRAAAAPPPTAPSEAPRIVPVEGEPVAAPPDFPELETAPRPPLGPPGDAGGRGGPQEGAPPGTGTGRAAALPGPTDYVPHDLEPVVLARVAPAYPEVARQLRMEGRVVVRLLVDVDGSVRQAGIETSNAALLEAPCLEAARGWRFRPATANGHPVAVWVRIPFEFRMK